MVRGRPAAPADLFLAHASLQTVTEPGFDGQYAEQGDLRSVPLDIPCERRRDYEPAQTGPWGQVSLDRPRSRRGDVLLACLEDGEAWFVLVAAGRNFMKRRCRIRLDPHKCVLRRTAASTLEFAEGIIWASDYPTPTSSWP